MWFTDIVRWLLTIIDRIVALFIEKLYVLLIKIANVDVFGSNVYEFMGRIYVFLGVFMLFKLSFSMVTYIINPDDFTDKSKGFSNLIKNVVISLVLIVTVPTLFQQAFKLQSMILNQNVVYRIVTGKSLPGVNSGEEGSLQTNATVAGTQLTFGIYQSFIYHEDENGVPGAPKSDHDFAIGSGDNKVCYDETSMDALSSKDYSNAIRCMISTDTINKKDGKNYANEYMYIICTIAGGFVAYILLVFCIDTAVRAVKLGFLQIIAPIPILSIIDPKGTKGGMFSKWLKEVGKTFADLFIRLAGIFFALEIVNWIVVENSMSYYGIDGTSGDPIKDPLVRIAIIIGTLMFAKQLPQFIESITGIKLGGDGFSLKKKLGGLPGAGAAKALGAAGLGFAGGALANTIATRGNWKGQGFKNGLKNVGSILGGGFSGGTRGLTSKEKNMFKAGRAGIKGAVDKRNLRDKRYLAGDGGRKGVMRRAGVGISNFAGLESGASKFDKEFSAYDEFLKQQSSLDSYIEGEIKKGKFPKTTSFSWTSTNGTLMHSNENVNVLRNKIDALKQNGASAEEIANAELAYGAAMSQAKIDYIDNADDNVVTATLDDMNYIRKNNSSYEAFSNMPEINNGTAWDQSKKTVKKTKTNKTISKEYRQAQANKKADAKQ